MKLRTLASSRRHPERTERDSVPPNERAARSSEQRLRHRRTTQRRTRTCARDRPSGAYGKEDRRQVGPPSSALEKIALSQGAGDIERPPATSGGGASKACRGDREVPRYTAGDVGRPRGSWRAHGQLPQTRRAHLVVSRTSTRNTPAARRPSRTRPFSGTTFFPRRPWTTRRPASLHVSPGPRKRTVSSRGRVSVSTSLRAPRVRLTPRAEGGAVADLRSRGRGGGRERPGDHRGLARACRAGGETADGGRRERPTASTVPSAGRAPTTWSRSSSPGRPPSSRPTRPSRPGRRRRRQRDRGRDERRRHRPGAVTAAAGRRHGDRRRRDRRRHVGVGSGGERSGRSGAARAAAVPRPPATPVTAANVRSGRRDYDRRARTDTGRARAGCSRACAAAAARASSAPSRAPTTSTGRVRRGSITSST